MSKYWINDDYVAHSKGPWKKHKYLSKSGTGDSAKYVYNAIKELGGRFVGGKSSLKPQGPKGLGGIGIGLKNKKSKNKRYYVSVDFNPKAGFKKRKTAGISGIDAKASWKKHTKYLKKRKAAKKKRYKKLKFTDGQSIRM